MKPAESEEVPITDPNDRRLYSEDGVDLTLIRWMLSLSPRERLLVLQNHNRSISRLLNAGRPRT